MRPIKLHQMMCHIQNIVTINPAPRNNSIKHSRPMMRRPPPADTEVNI